jgi:ectoine hydroxylase-related dioxygenase (phytanoyl-CoA dioxygenase family)
LTQGFLVTHGPVPQAGMAALSQAYDAAVLQADSKDIGIGSTTTRVHDFVNRGPAFDDLYLHAPVLEACCKMIRQPFRLSSFLARTVDPHRPAQGVHVDFPNDNDGWPMTGFILMIDDFRPENGATHFLPRSHGASRAPEKLDSMVPACGSAGSMIIYNGSAWHGHGPNLTDSPRRSIQGAFIRRTEKPVLDFPARMRAETLSRIGPLAKYLLAL